MLSSGYNFSVKLFWSAPQLVLLFLSLPAVGAPKPPEPVIVCFGDSLTAGYGADPGHAYPDYLQQLLDARGYHYHVLNKGISGDTTKDGVARLKDVIATHPAIAVADASSANNEEIRAVCTARTQ